MASEGGEQICDYGELIMRAGPVIDGAHTPIEGSNLTLSAMQSADQRL